VNVDVDTIANVPTHITAMPRRRAKRRADRAGRVLTVISIVPL
jgi:hypothetical protein